MVKNGFCIWPQNYAMPGMPPIEYYTLNIKTIRDMYGNQVQRGIRDDGFIVIQHCQYKLMKLLSAVQYQYFKTELIFQL